jgi:hypothetical protein
MVPEARMEERRGWNWTFPTVESVLVSGSACSSELVLSPFLQEASLLQSESEVFGRRANFRGEQEEEASEKVYSVNATQTSSPAWGAKGGGQEEVRQETLSGLASNKP